MSAKLLCATAIMAMGSFTFIDTADAQRRGGAERDGNRTVEAGGRRGGARQARGQRRNAQTNQAQRQTTRAARANRAPARAVQRQAAPRAAVRAGRNFNRPNRRSVNRNRVTRGWRQARRWAARRWGARPYINNHGCTAVARRANGNGRVIRGVHGEGFGRRACRKALNRCENQLFYRQAQGRNRYAACVVASR